MSVKHEELEAHGSIKILEVFLKQELLPDNIINHLRLIQDLRSSGVAHRKGERYAKNVSKHAPNKTRIEIIHELFIDMTNVFNDLTQSISR